MTKNIHYSAKLQGVTYKIITYYHKDGTFQGAEVTAGTGKSHTITLFSSISLIAAKDYLKDELTKQIESDMKFNY